MHRLQLLAGLKYVVQFRQGGAWETIAAFNCLPPADRYVKKCQLDAYPGTEYRLRPLQNRKEI